MLYSMSREKDTRGKILAAALAHIRRRGGADVSLGEIARAARLSRQAIYLHFADRADLMIALIRYVDELRGLPQKLGRIRDAPSGLAAIREMVRLQALDNPGLWPIARMFDAVRRQDPEVEQSWQDRLQERLKGCRAIVGRLEAEKSLRPGMDPATAADILWTVTSLRMWEDLVLQRNWSAEQYQDHVYRMLLDSLTKGDPADGASIRGR